MVKLHFKMKLGQILFLFILFSSIKGQIVINEFLASNLITAHNQSGDYGDWIELFNPTENTLILSGYYLSDDIDDLNKWVFPQDDSLFIIPAGELL